MQKKIPVFDSTGHPACEVSIREAKELVRVVGNRGEWQGERIISVHVCWSLRRNECQQGRALRSLAIEKYPRMVQGGLTRTEHQPRTVYHYRPLLTWPQAESRFTPVTPPVAIKSTT